MGQIFSFVIITYNRIEETIDAVDNILNHVNEVDGITKEIIIINNNSDVDYRDFTNFLDNLPPQQKKKVRYHLADENLGVPRGRNLGIRMASGETMIFIDDDATFIEPNVIEMTLDIFERYEKSHNVKIIAFREQNYYSKKYSISTKNKEREKQKEFFTNYYIGCGHVIKKEVINKVGFYIESFQYANEEYDLAFKSLDAGFRIFYTSNVTVSHKKSPKGRASNLTMAKWQYENKMIIAYKYLPDIYVFTHFIMWSLYFLYHSKMNIWIWMKSTWSLPKKMKLHQRNIISQRTIKHIKEVKGKIDFLTQIP